MTSRVNVMQQSPELFKQLAALSVSIRKGLLDPAIHSLVDIRASQLNGCSFCLDMHVKQAKLRGERELRLHHIAAWRDSPLFEPRERAALEWTELLTRLPAQGVPDEAYARARARFSEPELAELSFAVGAINLWNRLNVGFQTPPGTADKAYGLDKAGLA